MTVEGWLFIALLMAIVFLSIVAVFNPRQGWIAGIYFLIMALFLLMVWQTILPRIE